MQNNEELKENVKSVFVGIGVSRVRVQRCSASMTGESAHTRRPACTCSNTCSIVIGGKSKVPVLLVINFCIPGDALAHGGCICQQLLS